jgi:selenide,water dikinase
LSPAGLREALKYLPVQEDPRILVNPENLDDGGVYQLTDDLAIIQTVDFFPPILDDPYTFGQVAAANALSDIYAMGGEPLIALNITCFPDKEMPISILGSIFKGGLDKLDEAGVILMGGHSISDKELKYGFSVTGTVHPKKILRNEGAKPGDYIILTKPLGTGILATALKRGKLGEQAETALTKCMTTLNRKAMKIARSYEINAATDITGFGLAGHASEMADASGRTIEIDLDSLVTLPDVMYWIGEGVTMGGLKTNRESMHGRYELVGRKNDDPILSLVFDPQTSGGLFLSVPGGRSDDLLLELAEAGLEDSRCIGRVIDRRGDTAIRFC